MSGMRNRGVGGAVSPGHGAPHCLWPNLYCPAMHAHVPQPLLGRHERDAPAGLVEAALELDIHLRDVRGGEFHGGVWGGWVGVGV